MNDEQATEDFMKQIQIDEGLFWDITRYIIMTDKGETDEELKQRVIDGLLDKLKRIADRELYTAYKTAQTAEEREQARQKYLDSKGIPKDFRW